MCKSVLPLKYDVCYEIFFSETKTMQMFKLLQIIALVVIAIVVGKTNGGRHNRRMSEGSRFVERPANRPCMLYIIYIAHIYYSKINSL